MYARRFPQPDPRSSTYIVDQPGPPTSTHVALHPSMPTSVHSTMPFPAPVTQPVIQPGALISSSQPNMLIDTYAPGQPGLAHIAKLAGINTDTHNTMQPYLEPGAQVAMQAGVSHANMFTGPYVAMQTPLVKPHIQPVTSSGMNTAVQ